MPKDFNVRSLCHHLPPCNKVASKQAFSCTSSRLVFFRNYKHIYLNSLYQNATNSSKLKKDEQLVLARGHNARFTNHNLLLGLSAKNYTEAWPFSSQNSDY